MNIEKTYYIILVFLFLFNIIDYMIIITNISSLCGIRAARQAYSAIPWMPVEGKRQNAILAQSIPNLNALDFDALKQKGFWEGASGEQLDILVGSPSHRRFHGLVHCQVIPRSLPEGALLHVESDLYCTSPALTALLYARNHTFEQTFMLIMELLGSYTLPADATRPIERGDYWPFDNDKKEHGANAGQASKHLSDEDVLSDEGGERATDANAIVEAVIQQIHNTCEPATTLQDLKRFARWATGRIDEAFRQAVRLATEGSRSPAESIQYGIFGLPVARGGFNCAALPKGMKLNYKVLFDKDAVTVASGMPYAICDAYIPAAKVDIEYNGIGHELEEERIHDESRNNGLQSMGVRTIVISRRQMRDIQALEAIALAIYRFAGVRFRYQIKGYRPRQVKLLNNLRKAVGLGPV